MDKPRKRLTPTAEQTHSEPQLPRHAGNLTTRLREQFQSLHDEVKKLLKQGCIRKSTLEKVKELNQFVNDNEVAIRRYIERSDQDRAVELRYLKSRCMTAEIFDQFGLREEAREASREGRDFLADLPSEIDASTQVGDSREIVREKVRLCIDYVQTHFYREHDYPQAQKIVFRCRDFVEQVLQQKGVFNCHGTLGQIYYLAGKIHRQQNEYGAAEDCFSLAIENYYRRARSKIEQPREGRGNSRRDLSGIDEDLALTRLKAGISLALGIGWINYARGHLRQALNNNIQPARVLLLHARDELSSAYLDLVYSSITRALANKDDAKLQKAIRLAEGAYKVFRENEHGRYVGRAAWELGLAHFYSGHLDEAEEHAREVEDLSLAAKDHRWICNALILRSRIEYRRGQLNESEKVARYSLAEALATSARNNARQYSQTLCEINALISRSAVRIELERTNEAREDLEDALALNQKSNSLETGNTGNPKVESLCYLYLSRSYARENERFKANENFLRWKALERDVEHVYVRGLAHEVEEEINSLKKDFVIKAGREVDLDYKTWKKELQRFLLQEAKSTPQEKQEIAERLGISRQTVHDWEREFEEQNE